MKIIAKVIEIDMLISGQSDNGNDWEKQTIVVETLPTINADAQPLAIEFMGERKTKMTKVLEVGDLVEVSFSVRCNKYQDKWFTRLDGSKVVKMQPQEEQQAAPTPEQAGPEQ